MTDITTRKDVFLLVSTFYDKIRKDAEIGFVFNETITDWSEHIEKLTDFWENIIFNNKKYFGNPIHTHLLVDEHFNYVITPNLFGIWLNYWFETLNENFSGKNVELIKERARKMSSILMINLFQNKQK